MDSKVELFVNGINSLNSGTTIGQIDLFNDEPLSITYSIIDIKDISKRNSSVSQNFTVPATKNNNILFNHIFNIGLDSQYDPSKKTPCFILCDSLMIFQGNLQLTKIKVDNKNVVSYDIIVYGETADLVKELGDSELTDLDLSDMDHLFTVDNIMASWTADTQTLGYYYPLIDYGYDLSYTELNTGILNGAANADFTSNGNGLNPTIFRPALSVKEIFNRIMIDAGFTYESDFLNSEIFTELIIPYNGSVDNTIDLNYANQFTFRAGLKPNFPYNIDDVIIAAALNVFTFNDTTTEEDLYDTNSLFNQPTTPFSYIYQNDDNANLGQRFGMKLKMSTAGSTNTGFCNLTVAFYRIMLGDYISGNTSAAILFHQDGLQIDVPTTGFVSFETVTPWLDNLSSTTLFPLRQDELVYATYQVFPNPGNTYNLYIYGDSGTRMWNEMSPKLVMNGPINMNQFIPKKIKKIDFIKSIITMFNLMVIPSKLQQRRLLFIPRNEYFNSGEIKDWSNKLDSKEIEEVLISEQQSKRIIFNYKEDKDYYNTDYKTQTERIHGEYIETINNEWLDNNSKQDIGIIFSPTPLDNVTGQKEIIVPKIGKVDNNMIFGRTDFNIRILRKNPQLMVTTPSITIKMLGKPAQNSYPYAGHLDHPFISTVDYNFGTIEYSYYNTPGFSNLQNITPNNLVEVYWRDYLDAISDKNSKLIKCKIKLTPADISKFNYNDKIFIEGLTDDGGHYFLVNKLIYDPTTNNPSIVELIKLSNI